MNIRFDDEMRKKILIYSSSLIIAIVIGIIVYNFHTIAKYFSTFINLILPFLFGLLLAIILRLPINFLEDKVFYKLKRKRLISALIVFAGFIFLITLLIRLIIPNIITSVQEFLVHNESYIENLDLYLSQIEDSLGFDLKSVRKLIDGNITSDLTKHVKIIANYSIAFVHFVVNLIIALVSALYIILDKENLKLSRQSCHYITT